LSIAFPAILILFLVSPGLLFRYFYRIDLRSNYPFIPISLTDEIASSLLVATLFQSLWVFLASSLGADVNFEAVIYLLIGVYGKEQQYLGVVTRSITDYQPHIFSYFFSLALVPSLVGLGLNWAVHEFRLDRKFSLLRFSDEWYYLFRGEISNFASPKSQNSKLVKNIAGVYLATVVDQGKEPYLYRGIIDYYYFDKGGCLDRIVLKSVYRRRLTEDRITTQTPNTVQDERFYEVVGDYFVLKYSEMQTINIQYFKITLEPLLD